MSSRALRRLAAGLVLAGALGACAAGTTRGSDGARDADAVSGEQLAETVCASLDTWVSSVKGKTQGIAIHLADSPSRVKSPFSSLMRGLRLTTNELLQTVKEVGAPAVDGGEDFVRDLTTAFRRARETFAEIRSEVARLPEDDPAAFRRRAASIAGRVQTALETVMSEMGTARPAELRQAFENEPACADLVTGGL